MRLKWRTVLLMSVLLAVLFYLIAGALQDRRVLLDLEESSCAVSDFTYVLENGECGEVTLPHTFRDLPPRAGVELSATVAARQGDRLLVKSVYAPFHLYANGVLLCEYGKEGSYPRFFLDPPTILTTAALPAGMVELRFEYRSPLERGELALPAVSIGNPVAVLAPVFKQNAIALLLAVLLLVVGVAMMFFALLLRQERIMASFFWLGLFAITVGFWSLGECNLTSLLIPYPSVLYIMAFSGLFTMGIPLLRFGLLTLRLHDKRPVKMILAALYLSVLAALLLQAAGLVGLSRSMYFFHILIPGALFLFTGYIVWDYIRYKNPMARRFMMPIFILAFFSFVELVNYQYRFTDMLAFSFQVGVFLFVVSLGVICAWFVRDSIRMKEEKGRLEFEVALMGRRLEGQNNQYSLLAETAETLRAQRHDLRHQLIVIHHYNEQGDRQGLGGYVEELMAKIPVEKDIFLCENRPVNAVAQYYFSLAKERCVAATMHLAIPEKAGRVHDSDLCIAVGNLLENAIEASMRVPEKQRFIRMNSRIQYDTLTITVDNGFDGVCEWEDGVCLSRKREGKGLGLSSIAAVAKKYDGSAHFETRDDTVFMASIYVVL